MIYNVFNYIYEKYKYRENFLLLALIRILGRISNSTASK